MKLKILLTAVAFSLSSASFAGDLLGWNHSCWDNKTALFTDKINKASNKTAKNVGTGMGAIAGYWASGRRKQS